MVSFAVEIAIGPVDFAVHITHICVVPFQPDIRFQP